MQMSSLPTRNVVRTAVLVALAAMCFTAANAVAASSPVKAGPRDTVAIKRESSPRPVAQFAALSVDRADLAGELKTTASERTPLRRIGPKGTIKR